MGNQETNKRPEHMELSSADGTQLNLDALYRLAPSCFTETRDEATGTLRRVVHFDLLRQLLGDEAVESPREAYEFQWVGKRAARAEASRATSSTLRPVQADSVSWDTTQNLYLEGDNLEVLKLLQKAYMGKVKMIYIDPPYNTGNDFVYNDNFAATRRADDLAAGNIDEEGNRYCRNTDSNGRFHSDWCSMIYSRLIVARRLLSDDGAIFISIDDHEVENLKKICNEVFGESNFVANINWKGRGGRQDSKYFAVIHENILCYTKNIENYTAGEEIKNEGVFPYLDKKQGRYYKTQLLRKWGSNSLRENRPNLYYPIKAPDGTDVYPTIYQANGSATFNEIESCWRWGASNMAKQIADGNVEFQKNKYGKWIPYEKIFAPQEDEIPTKKFTTWIDCIANGTQNIKTLFGSAVFDYSKSPELICHFLKMSDIDSDSIVLDFFSGSATTAHAVMQLNAEDGGHRKFIMVQLPEETAADSEARKAGYGTICEIGKERIRRAGKKILEEHPEQAATLDTGFRVFRTDSTNMNDIYIPASDYRQDTLNLFADSVKADRNELDLLFGCMLDWGVPLAMPLTQESIDGCALYTVNGGDLVACFDTGITDPVLHAMADKQPLRLIFRSSCFDDDNARINIYETFKQLLDWSDSAVYKNIKVI